MMKKMLGEICLIAKKKKYGPKNRFYSPLWFDFGMIQAFLKFSMRFTHFYFQIANGTLWNFWKTGILFPEHCVNIMTF